MSASNCVPQPAANPPPLESTNASNQTRAAAMSRHTDYLMAAALLFLAFSYIKAAPLVTRVLPVDLTLLGGIVVALGIFHRFFESGLTLHSGFGLVAGLWVTFLLGIPPGPWNPATGNKIEGLYTLALFSALGGLYLLRTTHSRSIWLGLNVVQGGLVTLLTLVFPSQLAAAYGRLAIEGGSTISAGRATGAAVVVLVAVALGLRRQRRLAPISVALLLGVVMVGTGSRGPLLGSIVAVLIVALVPSRGRLTRLLLGGSAFSLMVYVAISDNLASSRLTTLDVSAQNRLELWRQAGGIILSHPFGIGWGNLRQHLSPGMMSSVSWVQYPHNLLIEVFSESSWIAGTVLVIVLAKACRRQTIGAQTPVEMAMLGLLVFNLVSAMFSSDVVGNRGVWVSVGAALALSRPARTKSPQVPISSDHVQPDGHRRMEGELDASRSAIEGHLSRKRLAAR